MSQIRPAIVAANEKFMSTFGRGDAAALSALYTSDGQLLPAGMDFVTGHESIQAFWQGAMNMGIKKARLETVEVESHGDTAHEVGRYTLMAEDDQVLDTRKYIVIWRQDGGQWKIHRDIWTSNNAPA